MTLDPRPSTLDPRPSTLDPRPSTLDPRPSTLDMLPSTLDPRHKPTLSTQTWTIRTMTANLFIAFPLFTRDEVF